MEWRDTGIILTSRPHGESAAILEVLTERHGRHLGVVHGGASRNKAPLLQPGNQVNLEWRARLEEHIGSYRVELLRSRMAILSNRRALAAMGSITALLSFALPERMELPGIYTPTLMLADRLLSADDSWISDYALWELTVLAELGYMLDLTQCAATGTRQNLVWVSPRSGRAVSAEAGVPYLDRLLPLPAFLLSGDSAGAADTLAALKLTGYFWENRLAPALGARLLPGARARFVAMVRKLHGSMDDEL
ncbi:MAG: DNA repair protein RecO [Rhodobacteraceae bacterium]|nr:DNA repair protein RecO [Paracoccaceae bacterium]